MSSQLSSVTKYVKAAQEKAERVSRAYDSKFKQETDIARKSIQLVLRETFPDHTWDETKFLCGTEERSVNGTTVTIAERFWYEMELPATATIFVTGMIHGPQSRPEVPRDFIGIAFTDKQPGAHGRAGALVKPDDPEAIGDLILRQRELYNSIIKSRLAQDKQEGGRLKNDLSRFSVNFPETEAEAYQLINRITYLDPDRDSVSLLKLWQFHKREQLEEQEKAQERQRKLDNEKAEYSAKLKSYEEKLSAWNNKRLLTHSINAEAVDLFQKAWDIPYLVYELEYAIYAADEVGDQHLETRKVWCLGKYKGGYHHVLRFDMVEQRVFPHVVSMSAPKVARPTQHPTGRETNLFDLVGDFADPIILRPPWCRDIVNKHIDRIFARIPKEPQPPEDVDYHDILRVKKRVLTGTNSH